MDPRLEEYIRMHQDPQQRNQAVQNDPEFLRKLIEMMKRRHGQAQMFKMPPGQVFSDTPGMGNIAPYQIPGLQRIPQQPPYESFQGLDPERSNMENEIIKHLMGQELMKRRRYDRESQYLGTDYERDPGLNPYFFGRKM